jgi:hypothetical protein
MSWSQSGFLFCGMKIEMKIFSSSGKSHRRLRENGEQAKEKSTDRRC